MDNAATIPNKNSVGIQLFSFSDDGNAMPNNELKIETATPSLSAAGVSDMILLNTCITNVIHMKQETIALRVEPKLKREVEIVAKVMHISTSEWLRTRIAYEVKHLVEDLKSQIVLEYMKGNLTKQELKELFGKTAEDIDFIIDKTGKDFARAKKLAK